MMRWPRPEHLDRMTTNELHAYISAIGIESDAQAALAEYRGESHHTDEADSGIPGSEGRADQRPGAAIP